MTSLDTQNGCDSLRTLAHLLEPCIKFMLETAKDAGKEKSRFHACAHGLRALLSCLDEYDNKVLVSSIFYESLISNIRELAKGIEECARRPGVNAKEMAQDLAFQLVEDMAVLLREKYLRNGCEPSPDELALMDYFETRGHWKFGDQTLVTEFYYIGLPIAVINDMVSSLS